MSTTLTQADSGAPVALITGAGRRLGAALAQSLAARGYRLALHAHRSADAVQAAAAQFSAAGQQAIALVSDLRDEGSIRQMVARCHETLGRIDVLINNAAIWQSKPLEAVTADDVREHFDINLLATFVCCQAAGLVMVGQSGGGAIVNIGDWAIARPYLNHAAYFAAKGAIPTLTRDLAVELAARNPRVRVNAVLPGPVLLPESMTAAERQAVIGATLVKREGTPTDLAQAVLFLIDNTFITGVSLPVDGGRSIYATELG